MNNASWTTASPEKSLYKIVKQSILQKIIRHEWNPGDCLPSELELASLFNASQGTVRKALTELEVENIVIRHQGKGTFVSSHTSERSLFRFFHFRGDDNSWQEPQSTVISCKQTKAQDIHIKSLGLLNGEKIFSLLRTRDFDGYTAIVEDISLPAHLFPDFHSSVKQLPNTLYQYYESNYGVSIARAEERVKATTATTQQAKLLAIDANTPLLCIERTAYSLDNLAVELRISYCLTDQHHYARTLD